MSSAGYLRFPHIRGDLLTFVADDDVWLAAPDGGRAWRVSSDHAPAGHPRLSPDGLRLAWTSHADGAPEVRVAEVDSGGLTRLTWWGDRSTRAAGWTAEGEVIALSATGSAFEQLTWAYVIPLAERTPRRQPFGPVADVVIDEGGTVLLNGTRGRDPAHWKRYRGGTAGRLWLRAAGERAFRRLLPSLAGQVASPMLTGGRFAFLSDHEGTGNVYSCRLDGSDLRRHTDHDGRYARQASTDGHRIVYQCGGDIWLLDDLSGQSRPLDISLGGAARVPLPRQVCAADHLGGLSCDLTGRASVIEVRGTVHWLTHRDGPARALSVSARARSRLPRVLGTSGQVVWVSDAGGEDGLEIAPSAPPGPDDTPRRVASGQVGMVSDLAAAPDGSVVAVAARDGRLHLADPASGTVTLLATSTDGPVTGLAFSPDSAWLAWAQPGPRPLSRIRLARLADGMVTDVTDGRFTDTEPAFTRDGRYLAFLSRRSFDPIYDAHFFDLSFPYGCRPYLVALAAATPSPFGPLTEGRPAGEQAPGKPPGPERESGEHPPGTSVDLPGLADRVIALPVEESLYSSLRSVPDGLAWLRSKVTGVLGEGLRDPDQDRPRPALERFGFSQRTCSELAGELDWFETSGDGTRLVIADRGQVRVVPADRKVEADSPDTVRVELSRARFLADPMAERRHALEEMGRAVRHDFWVADLADVEWDEVLDSYRPLVERTLTGEEFADLLWEVAGELGTSHAYVRQADPPKAAPPAAVAGLGADLDRDADGRWRVSRVLPGESSDPRARSPLAAPGAAVAAGEALLAVDGQSVDPALGPGPLLAGTAGKPVELTILGADGQVRGVPVVPLASDRRLRYQDWVSRNRQRVRELSGGRAGYLHVPDMMGEGWAHFHRDLRLEMTHAVLVVDVRHNRGGHVSELVVEKLARRIMGWDVPRGMQPVTYPRDAPRGPVVALADEFAGSDGDMVTAAIRILGLGPVVGARTWGGVVGYDDPFELADGTVITVPRYAISLEGFGWAVENHGVDPDVEVLISPEDWAGGRDPQLETAVRIGMESLRERPPATPPGTSDRPSRRRPPLPPRPGP